MKNLVEYHKTITSVVLFNIIQIIFGTICSDNLNSILIIIIEITKRIVIDFIKS